MAGSIGTAFVDVALDPKQISGQVNQAGAGITGKFGGIGKKAGLALGGALVAGVGAAVVAGKALYDIGAGFDAMSDGIRVATGKTDEDLKRLEDSAKTIATTIPASFEDAGTAVSTISSRLDLTGKPLEAVSSQVLELARLTGTDLPTALEATTRMLGDAGLKGADAGKGIDKVFRAAQETGTPVDRLMTLMTKFGGPMRQLGFSFEEQAALMGKFEGEGVNTELVMGSMRKALGTMAKAGKDAPTELRKTFDTIKNAKTPSEATAAAIELFGVKAGPDMAAALREGRFDVEGILDTIAGGSDTVLGAADDTNDFAEQWLMFKNKVAVAVAPVAERLFSAVGEGMAVLTEHAPEILAFLQGALGPALDGIASAAEDIGPALEAAFGGLVQAATTVGPALAGLGPLFADIGRIMGPAIAEVGAAVAVLAPVIGAAVSDILIIIRELAPVWKWLAGLIAANIRAIIGILKPLVAIIGGVIRLIRQLIQGDWAGAWDTLLDIVRNVGRLFEAIIRGWLGMVKALLSPFTGVATAIGNAIKTGVQRGVSAVSGIVSGAFRAALGAITGVTGAIAGAARAVGSAIQQGVMSIVRGLAGAVSGAMQAVGTAVGRAHAIVVGALRGAGTWLVGIGRQIIGGLVSGISAAWGLVSGKLGALAGVVTGALSGAGTWLVSVGRDVVQGLIDGMGQMLGAVRAKAAEIASVAKKALTGPIGFLTGSPSKVTMEIGRDVTIGLAVGMGKEIPKVVAAAHAVAQATIDASKERLSKAGDQLGQALSQAFQVAGRQARAKTAAELELAALEAGRGGGGGERPLTAAEALLADRERIREQAQRDQAVADARAQLAAARSTKARADAQKALDAALYDQETAALEARAEQERVAQAASMATLEANTTAEYEARKLALEAQIALEQQQADAAEWVREQQFQRSLANLQTYLNSRNATQAEANSRIKKLMETFGITYAQIGATMGPTFAKAVTESGEVAVAAVKDLHARLVAHIAAIRRAIRSVKGFKPGATKYEAQPAGGGGAWLEAPDAPSVAVPGAPAGDVTAGAVYVSVKIGDQQLRDIVRTEVSRGNTALAQALVAGGR